MKSEQLTSEQLQKSGFRLPEKLPFTGIGLEKLTISEVQDHGDHVKLFAFPSERYNEGNHIIVDGVGKVNHCMAVLSVPRTYTTLTAEGSRVYKTYYSEDQSVRIFRGNYTSGEVTRDEVPVIGLSILCKAFDLFKCYGGDYARADYKIVRPPDFRDNPYLELTRVCKVDGLKF